MIMPCFLNKIELIQQIVIEYNLKRSIFDIDHFIDLYEDGNKFKNEFSRTFYNFLLAVKKSKIERR